MSCVTARSCKSPRVKSPPTTESFNVEPHLCAYDDLAQHRTLSPANYERRHNFRTYHQKYSHILSNRQNRNVAAEVAVVKHMSDDSRARVRHKLELAEKVDPTEHGIGSNGGHIARLIKARGPLNGNASVRIKKINITASKEMIKSLQYELDASRTRIVRNPNWEDNFSVAHSLAPAPLYSHPVNTAAGHHRKMSKLSIEVEVSKIMTARGFLTPLPEPRRSSLSHGSDSAGSGSHRGGTAAGAVRRSFSNTHTPQQSNANSVSKNGEDQFDAYSFDNGQSNSPPTVPAMLQSSVASSADVSEIVGTRGDINIYAKPTDGSDKYDDIGVSYQNRRLKKVGTDSYKSKHIDPKGEFKVNGHTEPRIAADESPPSLLSSSKSKKSSSSKKFLSSKKSSSKMKSSGKATLIQESSWASDDSGTYETFDNMRPTTSGASRKDASSFAEATALLQESELRRPYTSGGSVHSNNSTTSQNSRYNPQLFIQQYAKERYYTPGMGASRERLGIDISLSKFIDSRKDETMNVDDTGGSIFSVNNTLYVHTHMNNFVQNPDSPIQGAAAPPVSSNSIVNSTIPKDVKVVDPAVLERMDSALVQVIDGIHSHGLSFGLDDFKFLTNRLLGLGSSNSNSAAGAGAGANGGASISRTAFSPLPVISSNPDTPARGGGPAASLFTFMSTNTLPYMCYVCVLMGLSPTVESVVQLFGQTPEAVLTFLQTVDPFALSIRRVRRALQLKYRLISAAQAPATPVVNAEVKIARWVNTFNIIAEPILAVYNIRRRHMELAHKVAAEHQAQSKRLESADENNSNGIGGGIFAENSVDSLVSSLSLPSAVSMSRADASPSPTVLSLLAPSHKEPPHLQIQQPHPRSSFRGQTPSQTPPMIPLSARVTEEETAAKDLHQRVRRAFCVDLSEDQTCFEFWKLVYAAAKTAKTRSTNVATATAQEQPIVSSNPSTLPSSAASSRIQSSRFSTNINSGSGTSSGVNSNRGSPQHTPRTVPVRNGATATKSSIVASSCIDGSIMCASTRNSAQQEIEKDEADPYGEDAFISDEIEEEGKMKGERNEEAQGPGQEEYYDEEAFEDEEEEEEAEDTVGASYASADGSTRNKKLKRTKTYTVTQLNSGAAATTAATSSSVAANPIAAGVGPEHATVSRAASMPRLLGKQQHFLHHHHHHHHDNHQSAHEI